MFAKCSRLRARTTLAANSMAAANEVLESFELAKQVYLLGSLERGLTVYNQQLRAHNLVWALREKLGDLREIAIVGGGIAGLTTAACSLAIFPKAKVVLFERLSDVCAFQQASDTRWLHPRIYDWPTRGSRVPSASLPVLNWSQGRAGDVARQIVTEFSKFCDRFDGDSRLTVFLRADPLNIVASDRRIWGEAVRSSRSGTHFVTQGAVKIDQLFEAIILAAGFGVETQADGFPSPSYWRNDQLAQIKLDGSKQPYLISGFGDGGVIDLCLRIPLKSAGHSD